MAQNKNIQNKDARKIKVKGKMLTLPFSEKKILAGVTKDNEFYIIKCSLHTEKQDREYMYFALTHEACTVETLTDSEGERRAKEYLEDGEQWRMAVEAERTTSSMEDFNEQVLNVDGWETVIGDVTFIGIMDNQEALYTEWTSGGASVKTNPEEYTKIIIEKEDLEVIKEADKLHLKHFVKMNKVDIALLSKVIAVFNRYAEFQYKDLMPYAIKYRKDGIIE